MPEVLDVLKEVDADSDALAIGDTWRKWVNFRDVKIEEWKELRNYLFATDTRTTSNSKLPWANSTTTPKLTQLRDNLHANYFAAIFPTRKWFKWEGNDKDSDTTTKQAVIQAYVETKLKQSGAVDTFSRLILDWIDTGNCFATVDSIVDFVEGKDGDLITKFVGPKLRRISPYDIVFNPVVDSFDNTPKIVKELVTVADLKKKIDQDPANEWMAGAFDKMLSVRGSVTSQDSEVAKADGFIADGFSSLINYFESGSVELLHYFGDLYNHNTGKLQLNRIITIADRSRVLRNIPNPSWLGASAIRHTGWRQRPDNLYGMGPLENLVGLQYRIDHLENLKADVWDRIAYPTLVIRGDVHDFGDDLGERIYAGEEGDVSYLVPDATALNADLQIRDIADKMEELAGAPRSAMGIRTPGEKTAFEFAGLQRAGNRIFEHKSYHFERTFVELLLNDYLEVGRRNLDESDLVRILDEDTGIAIFQEISREDITARGKLRPVGSRHFAEQAIRLQNLQNIVQLKQDPTVGVHMSGKEIARILATELDEPDMFSDNIAVFEQQETARLANETEVQAEEEEQIAIEEGI
jgi:hypothetical protein